jgi:hypothetical protein
MKKRYKYPVVVIFFVFACNILAYSQFAGGSGTESDPYIILDATHLNNVRNFPDSYFRQDDDIDFSKPPNNSFSNWMPIGGAGSSLRFTGHYDGNGKTISNLNIYRGGIPNVGLFGHIGEDGEGSTTIKNLGLRTVYVSGGRGTGALVGRVTGNNNTRIENCYVYQGTVSGDGATGGLVGSNNSYMQNSAAAESFRPVIDRCWSKVNVLLRTTTASGKDKFGGLAGCNQKGVITNSYSRSSVTVPGGTRVGGLAGCVELRGLIIASYSTGTVNVADPVSHVGGLVGMKGTGGNAGTVTQCFWDITTSGQATSAGGTGLTTDQMKNQASYVGWDFISTWQFMDSENDKYPVLINVYNPENIWVWTPLTNNTDWTNKNNWNLESVPPTGSAVMIPFSSDYPVLPYNESLHMLIMDGNAELMLANHSILTITGQLTGDNIFSRIGGEGVVELSGSSTQNLGNMLFDNLTIHNPHNVRLTGDIHVNGLLYMEEGLLDLNGNRIFMGPDAELKEHESKNSSSRLFGSSGYIEMTRNLNNPSGNISGIGLEIQTSKNLGSTVIRRGHSELNYSDDTRSILRWFDIIPTNNEDLDATIVFHYFVGELNLFDESANFSLFKSAGHVYYPGIEWIWVPSDVDAASKRIIAHNVESFSRWTAGSSDDPMPISLLSFQAKVNNHQEVLIEWVTAAEINNDYFTVERSVDGILWEVLTYVNGSGTTSRSKYYSATDTDPYNGISYYRLKQTDYDGTFEYFTPVSVYLARNMEDRITLYPNPNNGAFNIDFQGDRDVEWRIFDMQGRVIYSSFLKAREITSVNVPQLPAGLYTVVFYSDEVVSQKMMIR